MENKNPSRTIFIGNIPYGLSEEQIITIFNTAGHVLNFRLVADPETGRPKGYGFAEFADADAAASAVRNLNDYQIMGRQLRVDFSHKDNSGAGNQRDGTAGGQKQAGGLPGAAPPVNVSAVPSGVQLPPNVSCPDAISKTLASIPPAQLLDILSQFKGVVTQSPDSATELLRQQPQLAYAIFQCLLTMGLVESDVLKQVIEQVQTGRPVTAAPPPATATPPVQPPYQPPPTQQPQPAAGAPPLAPAQLEAVKQLFAMPPEQYNMLSIAEKQQIDALRAQYGSIVR